MSTDFSRGTDKTESHFQTRSIQIEMNTIPQSQTLDQVTTLRSKSRQENDQSQLENSGEIFLDLTQLRFNQHKLPVGNEKRLESIEISSNCSMNDVFTVILLPGGILPMKQV